MLSRVCLPELCFKGCDSRNQTGDLLLKIRSLHHGCIGTHRVTMWTRWAPGDKCPGRNITEDGRLRTNDSVRADFDLLLDTHLTGNDDIVSNLYTTAKCDLCND